MTLTHAPARSHFGGAADEAEVREWRTIATRVAADLASDVLERDAAGGHPFEALGRLKEAGLTTLLAPREAGGAGAHWRTAFAVIRVLARADASLAQLLAYHYVNEAAIAFAGVPERRLDWYRASTRGRWLWGDAVNPVDPDLVLHHRGDHLILEGTKRFCTGSGVGDVLLVHAVIKGGPRHGEFLHVVVENGRDGVEYLDDWDLLGQRQSSSNSVRFSGARIDPEDELGGLDDPYSSLVTPAIQLAFAELYIGIAEGALRRGREITNARSHSWFLSSADTYRDDPFVRRLYGQLVARTRAAAALADQAAASFDAAAGRGDRLTADDRGELAVEIAAVKVVATEAGLDAAHRIFEATGSSSTRAGIGLDLFWRNVRTHSLHDPVDYKRAEVGAHFLTGALPPVSLYT